MWQVTEYVSGGRRGLSFKEFEERLPEICLAHRAHSRALAFALVISDVRQPHLRKALEDDAYWQALDELSGRLLTVFAFEYEPRQVPQRSRSSYDLNLVVGVHGAPRGAIRNVLGTYFPGLSVERLPALLFFQVDESANVIGSCAAALANDATDTASAYNSLESVLQVAVRSLQNVDGVNAGNAREIYQLIVEGLHDLAVKRRIRSVFKGIKLAAGVTSIARIVSGLV